MAIDIYSHFLALVEARYASQEEPAGQWDDFHSKRLDSCGRSQKILKAKPLYPELLQNRQGIKATGNLGTSNIIYVLYHSKILNTCPRVD